MRIHIRQIGTNFVHSTFYDITPGGCDNTASGPIAIISDLVWSDPMATDL